MWQASQSVFPQRAFAVGMAQDEKPSKTVQKASTVSLDKRNQQAIFPASSAAGRCNWHRSTWLGDMKSACRVRIGIYQVDEGVAQV